MKNSAVIIKHAVRRESRPAPPAISSGVMRESGYNRGHSGGTGSLDAILESCGLFADLPAERKAILRAMAVKKVYRRKQMIFVQGQDSPGLFVVGKGLVRVFKQSAQGREHVLHLAGPGSTFAEAAAIGEFPCPAFAQALEPATCLLLPAQPFLRLLRRDHEFCLLLLRNMSFWVHRMVGLLEDVVLRDATSRLAHYLLREERGEQAPARHNLLKRHLASHLNLTSETLSRVLRRLTDLGVVETVGVRRLRVVKPATLRQIAQGAHPRW